VIQTTFSSSATRSGDAVGRKVPPNGVGTETARSRGHFEVILQPNASFYQLALKRQNVEHSKSYRTV